MHVRKIVEAVGRKPVETIGVSEPVSAAVARFGQAKVRSLVVVDADKLAGILTVRDLLVFLAARGGDGMNAQIREAMTTPVKTVRPDDKVQTARALLHDLKINHLPVVEGEKLVGIVTMADLLVEHLDDLRAFNDDLRRYIHGEHVL